MEMKKNVKARVISLKEAPVESFGTIWILEWYYAPLRTAFENIKTEYGTQISDKDCLKMDTYSLNTTTGPKGFCPMLLEYGILQ